MDKVLKQRLVGATILIALAVIFVPMLFHSPDRDEEREAAVDIPEGPDGALETRRLPLDPERARTRDDAPADPEPGELDTGPEPDEMEPEPVEPAAPDAEPEAEPVPDPAPEPGAEDLPDPLPEPDDEPETEPEPDPEPDLDEAPPEEPEAVVSEAVESGGWLVQVASFGSSDSADSVRERLDALGYDTLTDTIERGGTRLHRLRAGPFESESDAEEARGQISQTIDGVQPEILRAPGGEPEEAATEDAAPEEGRYAVQVGVFSSRENAEILQEQLEDRGFTVFLGEQTHNDQTTWRVRVGPAPDRDEASELARRLSDEAGLEGMVVGHP